MTTRPHGRQSLPEPTGIRSSNGARTLCARGPYLPFPHARGLSYNASNVQN